MESNLRINSIDFAGKEGREGKTFFCTSYMEPPNVPRMSHPDIGHLSVRWLDVQYSWQNGCLFSIFVVVGVPPSLLSNYPNYPSPILPESLSLFRIFRILHAGDVSTVVGVVCKLSHLD